MNMKLMGALVFGWMVSMQAGAAPLVKVQPKFLDNFASIEVKVLVGDVEQQHYQADVWGKFSAANAVPGNVPATLDKNTPTYTVGSKSDLRLAIAAMSEDRVDIELEYFDYEELRQYAEGNAPTLAEGVFEYKNMISLEKGKELRIPYSLCKDASSKICDRVLSITAN